MNSRDELLTPHLLREWPLPAIQGSKYARGQILVIGGARPTPGAAMLSATAAMRVGGGHLTLGVAESVAVAVAVALPESGVIGLPENDAGAFAASTTWPSGSEPQTSSSSVRDSTSRPRLRNSSWTLWEASVRTPG